MSTAQPKSLCLAPLTSVSHALRIDEHASGSQIGVVDAVIIQLALY